MTGMFLCFVFKVDCGFQTYAVSSHNSNPYVLAKLSSRAKTFAADSCTICDGDNLRIYRELWGIIGYYENASVLFIESGLRCKKSTWMWKNKNIFYLGNVGCCLGIVRQLILSPQLWGNLRWVAIKGNCLGILQNLLFVANLKCIVLWI